MNMRLQKDRLSTLAIAAMLSALTFQAARAAPLGITDVPLFLQTGAEPNVMLMFDNSGSMSNIVPDVPYDPDVTYLATCPTTNSNRIPASTQVQLNVVSGVPRIRISGTDYAYGTGTGTPARRCFNPTDNYLAALLDDNTFSYLPAQYTGNFLNWYFSTATDPGGCPNTWTTAPSRKPCTKSRLMIAKQAGVTLVNSMPSGIRTALSTYNGSDGGQLLSVMGTLDAAKRTALITSINGMTATGNTPLAETLQDIGYYFSRGATNLTLHPSGSATTQTRANVFASSYGKHASWATGSNPIQYPCQKSFAMLLTDGRPQQDRDVSQYIRDYTRDCSSGGLCTSTPTGTALPAGALPNTTHGNGTKTGRAYETMGSDYLDDVAAALYDMDLRPDLAKAPGQKNNVTSYFISFADDQAMNDPLMQSAATHGGGEKENAGNEADLIRAFQTHLASIQQRTGSASSASVNSGSINSDTRLFQASFDSRDWSGTLTARDVLADGSLGTPVFATLPPAASRTIITVNGVHPAATAVPFRWGSLDATRQAELQPSDTLGSNRLDWLRGNQAQEAPSGPFRRRTVLLGDLINSAPAFVGAPPFRYPDSLESAPYSAFRAAHQSRAHMVYVGSNDGMLHGFYTDDTAVNGVVQERLAFIPRAVFRNLHRLTDPAYSHQYYVDGSPVTGDAFVGGQWRTILVAGLNKGGQGIYALDITNPSSFSEANASSIFKWEFSDANHIDMGYSYSRPSIVKMNNGTWAAVFGNGYNNTAPDSRTSGTGNAVLYIVNLHDGSLLTTPLDTGIGMAQDPLGQGRPNGMSTPVLVDIDGDSDVDWGYAGDLFGNLWKFDLTSTSPGNWRISYGDPLFTAKDGTGAGALRQPITSRPNVSRGPGGRGLFIVFGTGKYLETSDVSLSPVRRQSFYGIHDIMDGDENVDIIPGRGSLTQQTITNEIIGHTLGDLRVTSNNPMAAGSRGWYIDLVSPSGYQAEMQVTDSLIRNGQVVFTTLVPNTDPCGFGGTSWLMEMNLFTGARLSTTPFDLNNDGLFTETVTVSGVPLPISGVRTTVGITPKPAPISGERCDYLIFPGTSGGTETRCRNPGPRGFGRQSWRQAQ